MTIGSTDFQEFDRSNYFPSLDGMRALCVLLVMFNHVHAAVPNWIIGWLGVDVFFVLSGFLITTLLIREQATTGGASLKGFYTRRFFRIIPIYVLTVILYAAALHVTHDADKTDKFNLALPYLLTFMQEYRPSETGNVLGHAWTLGIEEKFYVFWPLILITLFPFRRRAAIAFPALFLVILSFPARYARSYDGLLIGALLAVALSAPVRKTLEGHQKLLPAVPDFYLCLLVLGTYALAGFDPKWVLLFSASMALLIGSLVLRSGALRTLLESRVLVYIGRRSYAIYLIQVLVLDSVARVPARWLPTNAILVVAVSYVGCIAVASLM